MLTIPAETTHRFCDGLHRRNFLRIGSLGGLATGVEALGGTASKSEARGQREKNDRSVIMIYLPGGPTQHETFDPKPDAPSEIRGSFRPTSTAVPGTHFCELLPKLSAIADRFSVVRSLIGMENRHESFQCYSGRSGGRPQDSEPAGGWPTFGSFASHTLGPTSANSVCYVDASPKMSYPPYNNRGVHDASAKSSWPGFTGQQHIPFQLEGDVKGDLVLNGIDAQRLGHRRQLLSSLDRQATTGADLFHDQRGLDALQNQAIDMLASSHLAEALDLSREEQATIDRYGQDQPTDPSFGGAPQSAQHLLQARRLVEAGVRCVTVAYGAWDWHANREGTIEYLSKKYLPVFDHALSTLLRDLEERDLLDRVAVVVWGEFGRTPRINPKGGRDHWPGTQSVLMAGGGMSGGQIIGRTDRSGGVPIERPVHVQEVFATIYRILGIDTNSTKVADLNGRPRFLVDENHRAIHELFS